MACRREIIGPDGTVYPSLNAAAEAMGVSRPTIGKWCSGGRKGWRRGATKGIEAGPQRALSKQERGAIVSPVRILRCRPVDADDPRLWM